MDFIKFFVDLDADLMIRHLVTIIIAYAISLPIAWDREQESKSAGLRSFPLVAVATCGFTLIAINVIEDRQAQARILQGIITGIGFIGGGAILKKDDETSGTATAASFWSTGAIGISVAYGKIEIAVIISLIVFITLRYVKKFKSS